MPTVSHRNFSIAPDAPFYAVGDLHGCFDLLETLLSRIDPNHDQQIVFLGDYVDRGPDTARVLALLFELTQTRVGQVVCLKGNHEKMMCEFLDDPLGKGARWLRNGGVETLASYGISGISKNADPDQAMDACAALEKALPAGLAAWLRLLPLSWNSGNIWCGN